MSAAQAANAGPKGAAAAPPSDATEAAFSLFTAEENKEFQSIVADCNAFGNCERQHQEVLMTLESDEVLDAFRNEYEGLHNSLLHSHQGEGRLLRKCVELQGDIHACYEKALSATALSAGDQTTIAHLHSEAERASSKLIQVRDKESQLKEAVRTLKREIATLQVKAQEAIELPAQEAALQSLRRLQETVEREEDRLAQQLRITQLAVTASAGRIATLVEGNAGNAAELRVVKDAVASATAETEAIMAAKATKEVELRAVRAAMGQRSAYCAEQQENLSAVIAEHERNGTQLREVRQEEVRLTEEYQGVCRQLQHVNAALQECNEGNDLWQRRAQERVVELQSQQAAVTAAHRRYIKAQKILEALQRRNAVMEEAKATQQEKQRALEQEVEKVETDLSRAQRAANIGEKALQAAKKEMTLLQQSAATEAEKQQRNAAWIAEKRGQLHALEGELSASEEHNQQTRHALHVAMQEAEAHEAEAKRNALARGHILTEMESRQLELGQLEAQLTDTEGRVKQQHALLEAMVAERNTYTSHYDQLKHGLGEQQQNFSLLLSQIKTMKHSVEKRESEAKVEAAHIQLLKQQQMELDGQLSEYRRVTGKKRLSADALVQEMRQLRLVLGDAQEETARQQRRCRDVTHEKDVLHRQVMERTTELNALYDVAHTQQSELQRNSALHVDQSRELEHLEQQTTQLAQQLVQMRKGLSRLPELQVMVNNATRELQREMARVHALIDEAERPVNVHPYHDLAAAEPATYALVMRLQKLQRVLVERREELTTKEAEIDAVERRYMNAKALVAHHPGPEVAEQLTAYQQNLAKKQQQMRQMEETLSYFRAQTDQFKARHDLLRERLTEMGESYAAQRTQADRRHTRASGAGGGNSSRSESGGGVRSSSAALHAGTGRGVREGREEEDMEDDDAAPVYRGYVAPPRSSTDTAVSPLGSATASASVMGEVPAPQPEPALEALVGGGEDA